MLALIKPLAGASGSMLLGALLDALGGSPGGGGGKWGSLADKMEGELRRLGLGKWSCSRARVDKQGVAATQLDFVMPRVEQHSLDEVVELIESAGWGTGVEEPAVHILSCLAQAQDTLMGTTLLEVVGWCWGLQQLKVDRLYCQPMPWGLGTAETPAAASLKILKGIPLRHLDIEGELVTPTGAAIVACMASFQALPVYRCQHIGYGAGKRELPFSNILRIQLGEVEPDLFEDGN